MIKILFVCHGNICRSPMAEFVMKDLVNKAGLSDNIYIESAATSREAVGEGIYFGTRNILKEQGIPFEREKHLPIEFHGQILDCDYIADFVIDNTIILELKAVCEMNSTYESQVINYLKATGLQVGLLINFGQEELQVRRLAANIY